MHTCCQQFKLKTEEEFIIYIPPTRTFLIYSPNEESIEIKYCPWCANELPSDLTDELTYIIYDELGLNGFEDPRVPADYKTDRWWKNREI